MGVNGFKASDMDNSVVVDRDNNKAVDTAAVANKVINEVDQETGVTSPVYEYEFDTNDPILIARAVKLELLDGLTKAIYEGNITKLDFALYVARTELAKGTNQYLRLIFIDGMGYKNIIINPSDENRKMLGEDFKKVAESEDPTELGINFDMEFLKKLASELNAPKEDLRESTVIEDAKAAMDKEAEVCINAAENIMAEARSDTTSSSTSNTSSSGKSSFWDSDIVTISAAVIGIGAVAYGAYKLYEHLTDEGDIVILDDVISSMAVVDLNTSNNFTW